MQKIFAFILMGWAFSQSTYGDSSATDLDALLHASCMECHDAATETSLDLTALGSDFESEEVFGKWVDVFDRVKNGEMPPPEVEQPSKTIRAKGLAFLESKLKLVSHRSQQTIGRVPSRRLTRQEYEHTLHDLLGIGGDLAKHLPPESQSGAFDVVAAKQEISSVQVRGLLKVASLALEEAIQLGRRPSMAPRQIDYYNSQYIQMWVDRSVRRGGGTIFKTDQDVVTFRGANYVLRSDHNGYRIPVAGQYRITVKAAAHQPTSSITVSLKRQNDTQGESELFAAWDLVGKDYREVSTTKYLRPDDFIYVSADELDPAPDGRVIYNSQPASEYGGEGVKIRQFTVAGPLETTWPPQRTRELFLGIEWKAAAAKKASNVHYTPVLTKPPVEHVREIVTAFARRAYRRPVSNEEIDALVALAKPSLETQRDFVECVKVPLRAILVSPEVLFQAGPAGPLDGTSLARRLSYFLWRSLPDEELMQFANDGTLLNPIVLRAQVDRMLDQPKREQFVHEFLGQWLGLERIDATTPDAYLYPEYDDVLRAAMLAETRDFFAYLIDENLSVANLIDSEFTFLNRKLAEHYEIEGVAGEVMRKVTLEPNSVRGGILTHASIAKVTANGTVTTPVKRGNFVLTNLLGQPPSPPPPGVDSIEPDTQGASTIRETLAKHQAAERCAACHRRIDPPGFALECFDPVGTFRSREDHRRLWMAIQAVHTDVSSRFEAYFVRMTST